MTFGIVLLLTFLPFSAFAQTEPTYLRNMRPVAPVGSEEVTLTMEGTVHGGQFIFSGDSIRFTNGRRYRWAEKIFVNGEPWADITKPFDIGFTPDYSKAVILEKEGGPEGRIYIVPRENRFALVIAPSDDLLPSEFFRVKLAVKNQVPHDDLPPDETPPAGEVAKNAAPVRAARNTDVPVSPVSAEEEAAATDEEKAVSSTDASAPAVSYIRTSADLKIAALMNRKGFDLFRLLSEKDANANAFVSPYSIDSAFGMVYCGAKDQTAREIRTTLGLPADPAECGKFFNTVSREYAANRQVEVLVSNSVWYEQKFEENILPSFTEMIRKYYDGAFFKEDFTKPVPLAEKVNRYVEKNTKNMIRNLLSPGDFTERTFMILLNTLYFEAKWETKFRKEDTRPMPFRNFDGTEKQVRMMYRMGRDIGYYSNKKDNVHAVVLPYEDPRFELVALMPIEPGNDQGKAAMKNIISKIGSKLDSWLSDRSRYETRLWLPKVDMTCMYRLNDDLKSLGMTTPFSMTQANFHGIAEPSGLLQYIWIEKVIHKTVLKMDEETTKAAAATAIMMGFGGGIPRDPPPVNIFRADRPFLVLIRDNVSGLILFAGRINDPGVEAEAGASASVARRPSLVPAPPTPASPTDPERGFNDFESWLAMMQASASHWNEPTDGQAHPKVYMTSGHDYSDPVGSRVEKWEKRVSINISAEVDKEALFEIIENKIYYRPFRSDHGKGMSGEGKIYSFEGNYPVNVTVNGIKWPNLRKAFDLDFTPNLKSLHGVGMEAGDISFQCRCDDSYPPRLRLVVDVRNKGPKPAPVKIDLSTTAGQKQEQEAKGK
jgi:serpin B